MYGCRPLLFLIYQMQKVEADLNRSKQLRERQAKEFQRQIEEETLKHQQKVCSYSLYLLTISEIIVENSVFGLSMCGSMALVYFVCR